MEKKVKLKNPIPNSDAPYLKIITILYISHRIQAKIYQKDTLNSFL
jgi:hypothetical protein